MHYDELHHRVEINKEGDSALCSLVKNNTPFKAAATDSLPLLPPPKTGEDSAMKQLLAGSYNR
jgi:hypothetical protein